MSGVVLTDAVVLTMDAARTAYSNGYVWMSDGTIQGVGRMPVPAGLPDGTVIRSMGGHHLVMPGLVNAHNHISNNVVRGTFDEGSREDYGTAHVRGAPGPRRGRLPCRGAQFPPRTALWRDHDHPGRRVRARGSTGGSAPGHTRSGTAGRLLAGGDGQRGRDGQLAGRTAGVPGTTLAAVARLEDLERGFGSDLVTVAPEVLSPMRCTPEMIRTLHAHSLERGVPLFMHVGAARDEMDESVRRYGSTTVEFLESLGVLGPNTVLAHANYITEAENGLLARYETGVAHCPVANIWAGGRIPMLAEWVAAGIRVGLGTDGATSNNGQNLWETAKMAVLLQKTRLADRTYASAELGLELLTIGGARALHMEDRIGSLEAGKQADVICVDIDRPSLTPRATVTSNLVYSHDRAAVRHVYVGGVEQLRDGKPVNLDAGRVVGLVEEQARRVLSAPGVGRGFAERSRMLWADGDPSG